VFGIITLHSLRANIAVMLWVVKRPSGAYEHVVLTERQGTSAFQRLHATCEFSKAFCAPVEDGVRFGKNWIGRWRGMQVYVVDDDPPVHSLDVTTLFMAYFLSNRICCSGQPTTICEILGEKLIYTQPEAAAAIERTFQQATELLPQTVEGEPLTTPIS
jgi:hypothetical protein